MRKRERSLLRCAQGRERRPERVASMLYLCVICMIIRAPSCINKLPVRQFGSRFENKFLIHMFSEYSSPSSSSTERRYAAGVVSVSAIAVTDQGLDEHRTHLFCRMEEMRTESPGEFLDGTGDGNRERTRKHGKHSF